MKIGKNTDLYEAIENAIYAIFDEEIPLNDPTETTEKFVSNINWELREEEDAKD
jgi:hypothetical protein